MQRFPLVVFCLAFEVSIGAQINGSVYSLKPHIVCDKNEQFCADAVGTSTAFTNK